MADIVEGDVVIIAPKGITQAQYEQLEGIATSIAKVKIPATLVASYRKAFIAERPKDQIPDDTWVDPEDGTLQPTVDRVSDLRHLVLAVKHWIQVQYSRGITKTEPPVLEELFPEDQE